MLALRDNPRSRLAQSALDDVGSSFDVACAFMGPAFSEIGSRIAQVETEAAAIRAQRDELIRERDERAAIDHASAHRYATKNALVEDQLTDLKTESDRVRRRLRTIQTSLASIDAEI
jgi:hypothetical protein